jgi:hypothetical protein
VNGSTQEFSISILDSNVSLTLMSVHLNGPRSLDVVNSSVFVILSGTNQIRSSAGGITCSCFSSLRFSTADDGSIDISVQTSVGIGSDSGASCTSIVFDNGTFAVSSRYSTAIGSTDNSTIDTLLINSGAFSFARAGGGALIGAGASSSVRNLTIVGGSFELGGGVIGAASMTGGGRSSVGLIHVRGGRFTQSGSIGAGAARAGNATVSLLLIGGGTFAQLTAADGSAVVGAGAASEGGRSCVDNLTIASGTFSRLSASGGAAIGGGSARGRGSASRVAAIGIGGGAFEIDTGGPAGIGAGAAVDGGDCGVGAIAIGGGTFAIRAAGDGAGIGGGAAAGAGAAARVGSIEIGGGDFTVDHGELWSSGAGIGAGAADGGGADTGVGRIVIRGGAFVVESYFGAAVGGGGGAAGRADVGEVAVYDGRFALRAFEGAAIGGGYAYADGGGSGSGSACVRRLRISGGEFAVATKAGAGVGGGWADAGAAAGVGTLVVAGGTIRVDSADPTGVGTGHGEAEGGNASVDGMVVEGGVIEVGGARTAVGNVGSLVFAGKAEIDCREGVVECVSGDEVVVNGSIVGRTGTETFGVGSEWTATDEAELYVRYRKESARESVPVSALHFEQIVGLMEGLRYNVSFSKDGYRRTVAYDSGEAQGMLVSLQGSGWYDVAVESQGVNQSVCNGTSPGFSVETGDTFVAQGVICGYVWPATTVSPPFAVSELRLASETPFLLSEIVKSGSIPATNSGSPDSPASTTSSGLIVGLSVGGAVLLIMICGIALVFCRGNACHRLPDTFDSRFINVDQPDIQKEA